MKKDILLREVLLLKLRKLQEKQKSDPENRAKYDQQIEEILIKLKNNN